MVPSLTLATQISSLCESLRKDIRNESSYKYYILQYRYKSFNLHKCKVGTILADRWDFQAPKWMTAQLGWVWVHFKGGRREVWTVSWDRDWGEGGEGRFLPPPHPLGCGPVFIIGGGRKFSSIHPSPLLLHAEPLC